MRSGFFYGLGLRKVISETESFSTEKLPIRSVAGRVADRPNKHSSCLEPKELYFGFYYIWDSIAYVLAFRGSKLDESPVVPSIGVIEPR